MYASERLRNKKLTQTKILSPTYSRDAGAFTQVVRYKNSVVIPSSKQTAGQMLLMSSEGILANKGNAAVCCSDTITVPTQQEGGCCIPDAIQYPYPANFYQPPKPDCCPVNGPPLIQVCCPTSKTTLYP